MTTNGIEADSEYPAVDKAMLRKGRERKRFTLVSSKQVKVKWANGESGCMILLYQKNCFFQRPEAAAREMPGKIIFLVST